MRTGSLQVAVRDQLVDMDTHFCSHSHEKGKTNMMDGIKSPHVLTPYLSDTAAQSVALRFTL